MILIMMMMMMMIMVIDDYDHDDDHDDDYNDDHHDGGDDSRKIPHEDIDFLVKMMTTNLVKLSGSLLLPKKIFKDCFHLKIQLQLNFLTNNQFFEVKEWS